MMSKGILGGEFSSGIVRPLFPAVSLMTLALSVWVRFVAGRIDGVLARLGLVPTAGYVEPVVDPSVLRGILLDQRAALGWVSICLLVVASVCSAACLHSRIGLRSVGWSMLGAIGFWAVLSQLIAS